MGAGEILQQCELANRCFALAMPKNLFGVRVTIFPNVVLIARLINSLKLMSIMWPKNRSAAQVQE